MYWNDLVQFVAKLLTTQRFKRSLDVQAFNDVPIIIASARVEDWNSGNVFTWP